MGRSRLPGDLWHWVMVVLGIVLIIWGGLVYLLGWEDFLEGSAVIAIAGGFFLVQWGGREIHRKMSQ